MRAFLAIFLTAATLVPQAWAVDPAPYGRLPAVTQMSLSPSGKRYAMLATLGDKRVLVAADADANKALFSSGVGDIKVRSIRWVGENNLVIMVTRTENLMVDFGSVMELASVLRVDIKNKAMGAIFKDVPSVAPRVFGMYGTAVEDGKGYGYFGGITLETQTGARASYRMPSVPMVDLYKVELDTGKTRIEAKGLRENYSDWQVAPNGKVIATSLYEHRTGEWRLHPGMARNKPLMEKVSPLENLALEGQGRAPGTILMIDKDGEINRMFEVNLTSGASEELFKDAGVQEILHDPDSGLLIGARTSDRASAFFFDPELEKRWNAMLKTFPGRRVFYVSGSHDLERVILRSEGGHDSGTYWLAETLTGKTTPLGNAYPAVRPPQVGEATTVSYKAEDGTDIEGVLTLPPGVTQAKNLPMVMMPHGGPIGVHDEVRFDWWAQAFAANGYAVFQPNYRGSSGYSLQFEDAGYGEWGKKMLSDMKDGITALAAKGIIDPKRVCIVGGSYGGYAAMAGITVQQGLYKCAVALAGISDVSSFYHWWNDEHGTVNAGFRFLRKALGIEKGGTAVLDEISPITYAKRADAPILLIHGKDDTVVPISQSGAMESALKGYDKPVEFIRMDGEDHWLSHEDTRSILVKESVAFVLKHNPPDAAPAAAKETAN